MFLNFREYELTEKILSEKPARTRAILAVLSEFREFIQAKKGNIKKDQKIIELLNAFIGVRVKNIEFKYDKNGEAIDRNWKDNYLLSAEQDNLLTRIIFIKDFWKIFLEFSDSRFGEFLFFVKKFISHEHIHMSQNQAILKKVKNWKGLMTPDIEQDTIGYLSAHPEIMAWAYDAAIELKQQFGKSTAMKVLKDPMEYWDEIYSESPFAVYRISFNGEGPVYKKFIKYVVAYLERGV